MPARSGSADVQRDYEGYWDSGCDFCHEPFRESLVGAPDITGVLGRLSAQDVERMMIEGRGEMFDLAQRLCPLLIPAACLIAAVGCSKRAAVPPGQSGDCGQATR